MVFRSILEVGFLVIGFETVLCQLVMGDSPEKKMIQFDSMSNLIRFDLVQPISSHF